jgi:hypothetical protein
MIQEWYFGFFKPTFRNISGKIDFRCWFGHVCMFGYSEHQTWVFFDPKGAGPAFIVSHMKDEVDLQLHAHFAVCDAILRMPARNAYYSIPLHGPLTCASICGYMVGIRAWFPATLKRKLLAKGAEVIHGPERRSTRQGDADARTPDQ